jgi:hypothetical protein
MSINNICYLNRCLADYIGYQIQDVKIEFNTSGCLVVQSGTPAKTTLSASLPKPYGRLSNLSEIVQIKMRRALKKIIHIYKGVSRGARPLTPHYHPEFFDRRHRRGRLMEPFFKIWRSSTTRDDYDSWLHKLDLGQEVVGKNLLLQEKLIGEDQKPIPISEMRCVDEKQLESYEMQIDEQGRIFTKNTNILHSTDRTKDNSYIFVIAQNNRIYIGRFQRGVFSHASFLSGRAVKSAGVFIFDTGKLRAIWDDSGHYNNPDHGATLSTWPMMTETVRILAAKGIDMSKVEIIFSNDKENNKTTTALNLIKNNIH